MPTSVAIPLPGSAGRLGARVAGKSASQPLRKRAKGVVVRLGLLGAPPAILLLIASFLAPTELSLYVAGLRLPPHRVALILLFPFAAFRLLVRRDIRIRSFDLLFLNYNLWTVGAFVVHGGGSDGLVFGGSLALESFGAYLVARAYVRDVETCLATLRAMLAAIVLSACIALPETLLGQTFVHDLLKSLTGYEHPTAIEQRLGLTRAYGTFDHPIHYGTFCAGVLAMIWFAERRSAKRHGKLALISGATFLGLSSAPMLCLGLQMGLVGWEKLTRGIVARAAITLAVLAGLYVGVSMVGNRSPIAFIATGMTLDSWTGFYRLQIWEAGLNNVWANPWLGIGLEDWERPWWMISSTIDAFWLVITIRTGIPTLTLIALALIVLVFSLERNRQHHRDPMVRRIGLGWLFSLIALCLVAVTVHYWNVLHAFFFFFIGLGGWIADPKPRPRRRKMLQPAVVQPAAIGAAHGTA